MLIQGPDHGSLLHHAAKSGHGEIVKYILEHGESVCKPTESCSAAECVSQVKPHSTVWLGAFSLIVVTLGQMSTCSRHEQESRNVAAMTGMAPNERKLK